MQDFEGRIAVVTGGGTGMGRELVRQLTAEGCHVAMCDVTDEEMPTTAELALADAPGGTRVTSHLCDVTDEAQIAAFRDAVADQHDTDQVHLLFNNAGIGGGGSFVTDSRENWELTFDVCWGGVYLCSRAFLPMLVAADAGYIVNTSSINGFWASVGPDRPHTSYSAAKFAVKGFTEALIADLRVNAPHVKAAVVMPGHIGTSIAINSRKMFGPPDPTVIRKQMAERGLPVDQMSDDDILDLVEQLSVAFRDQAPTTAAVAATVILDGVKAGKWRILVGDDAVAIDELVREDPEAAYEPEFIQRMYERGHFGGLIPQGAAADE